MDGWDSPITLPLQMELTVSADLQGRGCREANEIVRFGMVYWIQGQIAPRRQLRRTGTVTPLETILWAGDGFISSAVLICIFRKPKPVVWESANEPSPLGGDSLMA